MKEFLIKNNIAAYASVAMLFFCGGYFIAMNNTPDSPFEEYLERLVEVETGTRIDLSITN